MRGVYVRRGSRILAALSSVAVVLAVSSPLGTQAQVQRELLNPGVLEELYTIVARTVTKGPSETLGGLLQSSLGPSDDLRSIARTLESHEVIAPVTLPGRGSPVWRASGMSDELTNVSLCTKNPRYAFACTELQNGMLAGRLSRNPPAHLGSLSTTLLARYETRATIVIPKSFDSRLIETQARGTVEPKRFVLDESSGTFESLMPREPVVPRDPTDPLRLRSTFLLGDVRADPGVVTSILDSSDRAYRSLGRLPFSGRDVRFISFVDDTPTQNALSPLGKRATVIRSRTEADAFAAFRSALRANRGRQVFVVFHNESGALTVRDSGGVRYRMNANDVSALAAEYGVRMFPVTCRGASRGYGSGFYEDVDAPQMVEYILGAARGARTQRDFVRGLGSEMARSGSDVAIDPADFATQGRVTLRCRRRMLGTSIASGTTIGLGGYRLASLPLPQRRPQ